MAVLLVRCDNMMRRLDSRFKIQGKLDLIFLSVGEDAVDFTRLPPFHSLATFPLEVCHVLFTFSKVLQQQYTTSQQGTLCFSRHPLSLLCFENI